MRAVLRRRAYAIDIDDVIAETAVRAVEEGSFESPGHLTGWAIVVALNLMRDEGRKRRRRNRIDSVLVERPYNEDLADLVAEFAKRDALLRKIEELPAERLAALLDELVALDDQHANQIRVMKCRTKKDLRTFYRRLGVAIGGWRQRGWLRPTSNRKAAAAIVGATTVTALVTGAVLGIHITTPEPHHRTLSPLPHLSVATRDRAPSPTVATETTSPGQTHADHKPAVRIGLGSAPDGRQRRIEAGRPLPEEAGVLACIGYPRAPESVCVHWPEQLRNPERRLRR